MEAITIELDESAYVLETMSEAPSRCVDRLTASAGSGAIVELEMRASDGHIVGGLALRHRQMDRLCKEWINARRMCPFCKEPGMDVRIDEQPFMDAVETQWWCEHCGGEIDTLLNPGNIPWEDPLGESRNVADEDVHRGAR